MSPIDPMLTHPSQEPAASSDAAWNAGMAAAFSAGATGSHHPTTDPESGTILGGKYRLSERIGEGGMGSVWVAHQSEPVKRKVAIKLIKAGMDTKSVLARFEAERQALAVMDHPNIAKVLDGGLHDGRPFFVMELVKGVPITEYSDARKLTPKERLELFVPVCQAIQHAHQKGIIHRDIKPSNVLIALYDDKPVPKVIDFGIAKATGGTLTEHSIETQFGGVVGTPQYMSPEQASLNNLDIDTRSDVYSLGILLYELLAGSPPFAKVELEKRGLLEMLRIVREEEPPRPSTKLSTADALPSLSANRGTEPKKLTGLLRNELDWIVMKALEKDRSRRYETANGFAADINRYLAGEAVHAHPPSVGYRLRKFVRRNKGQVIAASLVFAVLVLGMAGTTFGLFRATKAEATATKALAHVTDEQGKTQAALIRATDEEAKARAADADSRKQLARQYVERGWKLLEEGNAADALHWYVAALGKEQDLIDADRERVHRTRIAATMEACPRPTHILFHSAPVWKVVYSADGRRVVTAASADWLKIQLRVWDAATGAPVSPVIETTGNGMPRSASQLHFDPTGTKVVFVRDPRPFGGQPTAKVGDLQPPNYRLETWDVVSGRPSDPPVECYGGGGRIYTVLEHTDPKAPAWPPKAVYQIDAATLRRTELPPLRSQAMAVSVDPTGRYCVLSPDADGAAELWSLNPRRRITRWVDDRFAEKKEGNTIHLSRWGSQFTPDGSRCLLVHQIGGNNPWLVQAVESATGKHLFPPLLVTIPIGNSTGVRLSPDGSRFLVVKPEEVTIHELTGTATGTYRCHPGTVVYEAEFNPTGAVISVECARPTSPLTLANLTTSWNSLNVQGHVVTIEAATGRPVGPPIPARNYKVLSPTGTHVLTHDDRAVVQLWHAQTGEPLSPRIPANKSSVTDRPPFSLNGRFFAVTEGDTVRVWDTGAVQPVGGGRRHGDEVTACVFAPALPQLATASKDGAVRLWDTYADAKRRAVGTGLVGAIVLDPTGERALVRSNRVDTAQYIWDVGSGRRTLPPGKLTFSGLGSQQHFAAGGRTAFYAGLEGFWLCDAATGRVLRELPTRPEVADETVLAAISPDGSRILTLRTPDGEARWWDAATGEPIGPAIPGGTEPVKVAPFLVHRPNPNLVTLRFRTEAGQPLEVEPTVWDPTQTGPVRHPWRPAPPGTDPNGKSFPSPPLPLTVGPRTLDPIIGADGRATGWRWIETAARRELGTFPAGDPEFTADGRRVAIFGTSELTVWDAATGASVGRIPLERRGSRSSAFRRTGTGRWSRPSRESCSELPTPSSSRFRACGTCWLASPSVAPSSWRIHSRGWPCRPRAPTSLLGADRRSRSGIP